MMKKKTEKMEKEKIVNSLMAFYQMTCDIVDDTQKDVQKKMFSVQGRLFNLIIYHAQFVTKDKILVPQVDENYTNYCTGFKEADSNFLKTFDETVEKLRKKDDKVGYII